MKEGILTPKELEEMFGIKVQHQAKLRMKVNQKKPNPLPFSKIGKKIFYDRERIIRWIKSQEVKA